jgi:hypothetical protein
MVRYQSFPTWVLLLVALDLSFGCGDDDRVEPGADAGPVAGDAADESGRSCSVGVDAGSTTLIASPALECQSRTCVHVADHEPDLCTAPCSIASDCQAAPETPCLGGFTCDFAVSAGPFACRKYCLCQAYVPDGGLTTCN